MAMREIYQARLNPGNVNSKPEPSIEDLIEKIDLLTKKVKSLEKELVEVKVKYNDIILWLRSSGVIVNGAFNFSSSLATIDNNYSFHYRKLPILFRKFLTKEQVISMFNSDLYKNDNNYYNDILPDDSVEALFRKIK